LDCFLRVRDDRNAVRFLVEDLARIASGLRVVDHADDRVPLRISDETVRRLPRVLSKITVAEDDGPLHSPESLVITAGESLWTAIKASCERRHMMVAGFRGSQRTVRLRPCDGGGPRGGGARTASGWRSSRPSVPRGARASRSF